MGYSIDVDESNYSVDVVEKSYEQVILIDFYATWCGPCQILKPILEKLVKEYNFILAKVDIDQNQNLANQFGIEGVPDVRVVIKGEMMSGFVGALTEEQIRKLLDNLNLKSSLEEGLQEIKSARREGDFKLAKIILDRLFNEYPEDHRLILESAQFLIGLNKLELADQMLTTINPNNQHYYAQAQGLQLLIRLKQSIDNGENSELDLICSQAIDAIFKQDYQAGLQLFLSIVKTNRKYQDDGARKAILAVFNLLGKDHPLSREYQQQLMMTLY